MALNIKYRQIKAFIELAETRSFTSAAERLSVTQPSLSTLLKELEQDLGVTLVNRSTRSVTLTESGREFYEQARGSIDQLEKAYSFAKAVGKAELGRLRLVTLPSLASGVVVGAVAGFRAKHPGVRVELMERTYASFLLALRQQEVDVGIGVLQTAESEIDFTPLFEDRLVIVTPKGHPLSLKRPKLKSLSQYNVVMVAPGPSMAALNELQDGTIPSIKVEQPSTAISMVRLGLGVTVTTSSALAGVDTRGLCRVPVQGPLAAREVGFVVKRDAHLGSAATSFIQLLQELYPTVRTAHS